MDSGFREDLRENNLDNLASNLRAIFERTSIEKNPHHSCAMSLVFLNRSVQIRPKSWRDIVQVTFSQVLS